MKIEVLNTYKEIANYMEKVKSGISPETAWEEAVVSVYWDKLCCYAPFDLSDRKPKAITDIKSLKQQYEVLKKMDVHMFQEEFERVATILPNFDDDPITVAFFPSDANNQNVNEKQNGVVGTSLFGNMFLQINPLVDGFEDWIKYVFAHEYHHTVWGNYWFMIHGGELQSKFIESLVIDGEADSFACELYPTLKPQWIYGLSKQTVRELWEKTYSNLVLHTDVDYVSYMFGNTDLQIPWCAGYAVGFMLVQAYLEKNGKTVTEILELHPEQLLEEVQLWYTQNKKNR